MGLDFSFDDISLDEKVSREQLEIDLYDELITISDAEPDEQVRMLSAKPAAVVNQQEDDKPESPARSVGNIRPPKDWRCQLSSVTSTPRCPPLLLLFLLL